MSNLDYEILCYRVMFRFSSDVDFSFEDFGTEEKAITFMKAISTNPNIDFKMLKVLSFVGDL